MYQTASPETILSERYEITEPIKHGAALFKAYGYDRETGAEVFMKARSREDSDNAPLRTYNEANQQASLPHAQIPRLIEAEPFHEYPYIVMERKPGTSSVKELFNRQPNYELAARLGLSLAQVLTHVHERYKLHRDIKEANLSMQESGRVALLDFELTIDAGEAAEPGSLSVKVPEDARITSVGHMIGTPSHMAPEQLAGGDASLRSEVHAFGVTMYGLTYGRPPFSGTAEEVAEKRATQEINFWPKDRQAPNALRLIIQKATQPDPASRYESVAAMGEELERFLVDSNAAAEPKHGVFIGGAVSLGSVPSEDMPTEEFRRLPRLAVV